MSAAFSDKEVLQHFVTLADELIASKYLKQSKSGGLVSAVGFFRGIGYATARSTPDVDFVKAALLTIRLFCQDNEVISLRNMANLIERLPVDDGQKKRFEKARKDFNDHLRGARNFSVPVGIGADTRRDIFFTFLYGQYAHLDLEKQRRLQSWEKLPEFDGLKSNFDLTMITFISSIAVIREVAAEILAVRAVA